MNSEKVIELLEQLLVELKKQPEKVEVEEINYEKLGGNVCCESVADYIDLDDLASRVVVDESEVASNLNPEYLAECVKGSDIVDYLDYEQLDYEALAKNLIRALAEGDI